MCAYISIYMPIVYMYTYMYTHMYSLYIPICIYFIKIDNYQVYKIFFIKIPANFSADMRERARVPTVFF